MEEFSHGIEEQYIPEKNKTAIAFIFTFWADNYVWEGVS